MPDAPDRQPVIVHLIDGTYELFRHFYGSMRGRRPKDPQFAAVRGVLGTVLGMIEGDATHIGVATDHVIESFRNDLWPGYKTGAGVDPALKAQFEPLEQALAAMGVAVWPMVELEADDAMASAVHLAAGDASVHKVCIWTPDKDLAQCVSGAAGRPGRPPKRHDPRCRGRRREVRRRARAHPGLPGAGRRFGRRLSRHQGHRGGDRGRADPKPRRHRAVSRQRPGRPPRAGAAVQDDRHPAHRRAAVQRRRRAALGRPGGAFGSLPAGIVDDALAGRVAALVTQGVR